MEEDCGEVRRKRPRGNESKVKKEVKTAERGNKRGGRSGNVVRREEGGGWKRRKGRMD